MRNLHPRSAAPFVAVHELIADGHRKCFPGHGESMQDVLVALDVSEAVQGRSFDHSWQVPLVEPRSYARLPWTASWGPDARLRTGLVAVGPGSFDVLVR